MPEPEQAPRGFVGNQAIQHRQRGGVDCDETEKPGVRAGQGSVAPGNDAPRHREAKDQALRPDRAIVRVKKREPRQVEIPGMNVRRIPRRPAQPRQICPDRVRQARRVGEKRSEQHNHHRQPRRHGEEDMTRAAPETAGRDIALRCPLARAVPVFRVQALRRGIRSARFWTRAGISRRDDPATNPAREPRHRHGRQREDKSFLRASHQPHARAGQQRPANTRDCAYNASPRPG